MGNRLLLFFLQKLFPYLKTILLSLSVLKLEEKTVQGLDLGICSASSFLGSSHSFPQASLLVTFCTQYTSTGTRCDVAVLVSAGIVLLCLLSTTIAPEPLTSLIPQWRTKTRDQQASSEGIQQTRWELPESSAAIGTKLPRAQLRLWSWATIKTNDSYAPSVVRHPVSLQLSAKFLSSRTASQ